MLKGIWNTSDLVNRELVVVATKNLHALMQNDKSGTTESGACWDLNVSTVCVGAEVKKFDVLPDQKHVEFVRIRNKKETNKTLISYFCFFFVTISKCMVFRTMYNVIKVIIMEIHLNFLIFWDHRWQTYISFH